MRNKLNRILLLVVVLPLITLNSCKKGEVKKEEDRACYECIKTREYDTGGGYAWSTLTDISIVCGATTEDISKLEKDNTYKRNEKLKPSDYSVRYIIAKMKCTKK